MAAFISDIDELQGQLQERGPEKARERINSEELSLLEQKTEGASRSEGAKEIETELVQLSQKRRSEDENDAKSQSGSKKKKKGSGKKMQLSSETPPEVDHLKQSSPLGVLPPLKNERLLLKKPLEESKSNANQAKEAEKWWEKPGGQPPAAQKGAEQPPNQKLERYNPKMQTISEADDALLEESLQNLNNLLESNKLKNSKLKHLFQISDNLKIDSDDEIEEQKNESNSESVTSSQQRDALASARTSKDTYEKIKNYMHQIFSYHQILGDEKLQKSFVRQFDYQREAFWQFKNEELEDIRVTDKLKLLVVTWNLQGNFILHSPSARTRSL